MLVSVLLKCVLRGSQTKRNKTGVPRVQISQQSSFLDKCKKKGTHVSDPSKALAGLKELLTLLTLLAP